MRYGIILAMTDDESTVQDSAETPMAFRGFFADVFARLDAVPKRSVVKLLKGGVTVDLEEGEPVFVASDGARAKANFRGRWLAEHPVPLALAAGGRLTFVPTSGNRVKVRRSTFWERFFG